jgi:hypothetical protein
VPLARLASTPQRTPNCVTFRKSEQEEDPLMRKEALLSALGALVIGLVCPARSGAT